MRAVMVESFGPLENAAVKEVDAPAPGPNEVLIEVRNAGVNFPDVLIISGAYQVKPELPFIPGMEVSGVVTAVGENVEQLKPGQRVAAHVGHGAYAEQVVAPEAGCYPLPDDISFEHAAALGLVYQTAHFALSERAHVSAGERVLVTGAAGGVGMAAIQLIKAHGAIAFAGIRRPEQEEGVREAGADHVVSLSGENLYDDLRDQIHALTNSHGVDVVVDTVGGGVFDASLRALAWGGRMIVVGFASGEIPSVKVNYLLLRNLSVIGLHWADYLRREPQWVRRVQSDLYSHYTQKKIQPQIMAVHKLEDFHTALEAIKAGRVQGKVLLEVS
ncbi:MAG: NADPH:quinone oxidoreductase family protein [Gammaproteobacteria bacterium]|nr:NADPH:quinone oxidoreductase family protein [Gammaproteobacteria bacterium]